ncbi:MAG: hypothetical protein O9327_00915 [Polaromonas sp.]|nr:hypothetical protein [Polaromonas sp.]
MIVNPSDVIDDLIHRITSIVLRTYEVEQLLPDDGGERLSLASHELISAVSTDMGHIEFSCELLLKADARRSSFLVKVQGRAAYETPIWRINEIDDVVVDPQDRGDSGFAGLG